MPIHNNGGPLPHVGLRTGEPPRSLYGDNSTIGLRSQFERLSAAAVLADAMMGEMGRSVKSASVILAEAWVSDRWEESGEVVEAQIID